MESSAVFPLHLQYSHPHPHISGRPWKEPVSADHLQKCWLWLCFLSKYSRLVKVRSYQSSSKYVHMLNISGSVKIKSHTGLLLWICSLGFSSFYKDQTLLQVVMISAPSLSQSEKLSWSNSVLSWSRSMEFSITFFWKKTFFSKIYSKMLKSF